MKICGHCQKEFPRNSDWFDRDGTKEDGFKNWCKQCRAEKRQQKELAEAADTIKKMDLAVLGNLAQAKPGGTTIPHAAEIYQNVMALMGGVQGYAMRLVGELLAAPPGGQIRQRYMTQIDKMAVAVSDSNKVSMPAEMMSDEDLETELAKREARMKIVPGTFTDVTDAKEAG